MPATSSPVRPNPLREHWELLLSQLSDPVTPSDLAAAYGVTVQTVGVWIRQRTLPPPLCIGGARRWKLEILRRHLLGQTDVEAGHDADAAR